MILTRQMLAAGACVLLVGLPISHGRAQSADPVVTAPKVFDASVPRDQQIALATAAAPASVSSHATVYVLGARGYEVAREGTNGFSCLVFRSYVSPSETTVGPMCFDAEGSRTMLPVYLHNEELRSSGKPEADIKADAENGYKDGRFKHPSKIGLLYMMSDENRLGPTPDHTTQHFPPHLMFYAPYMTAKDLGFDATPQLAYMGLSHAGEADNLLVVVPRTPPAAAKSSDEPHTH